MQQVAAATLPRGYGFGWEGLSWDESQKGNAALYTFLMVAVFVYLVLVAHGAGAIANRTIGVTGVGGMLLGTVLGVIVIPGPLQPIRSHVGWTRTAARRIAGSFK